MRCSLINWKEKTTDKIFFDLKLYSIIFQAILTNHHLVSKSLEHNENEVLCHAYLHGAFLHLYRCVRLWWTCEDI